MPLAGTPPGSDGPARSNIGTMPPKHVSETHATVLPRKARVAFTEQSYGRRARRLSSTGVFTEQSGGSDGTNLSRFATVNSVSRVEFGPSIATSLDFSTCLDCAWPNGLGMRP